MNHVTLIGRLAADPEARTTQSGISQCSFRLAVPRRFANQQGVREADFLNIVAWRGTADFCARYFHKGMRVGVEGSLQTRSWQAQDGTKRYAVEVIADNVEFCESREGGGAAPAPAYTAPAAPAHQMSMREVPPQEGFTEVEDDEMPF
nr:MAG TPA: Single strand binding protein [Caudoviricetes sp.]